MSDITKKLDERIEEHLNWLATDKLGSTESANVIDDLTKLHKMRMDELKLKNESEDKQRCESADEKNKEKQLAEQKKDRRVKIAISAAEIVLPLAVYGVLAYIGYAREFDGFITSDTLKRVLTSIKKK